VPIANSTEIRPIG